MGNKWNDALEVIHPPEAPMLHVESSPSENGDRVWKYVSSVGEEARLLLFKTCNPRDILASQFRNISFRMMPELTTLPPAPVDVRSHVQRVLAELFDEQSGVSDVIRTENPEAIGLETGRLLHTPAVEVLRTKLLEIGYPPLPGTIAMGRGKRTPISVLQLREIPWVHEREKSGAWQTLKTLLRL